MLVDGFAGFLTGAFFVRAMLDYAVTGVLALGAVDLDDFFAAAERADDFRLAFKAAMALADKADFRGEDFLTSTTTTAVVPRRFFTAGVTAVWRDFFGNFSALIWAEAFLPGFRSGRFFPGGVLCGRFDLDAEDVQQFAVGQREPVRSAERLIQARGTGSAPDQFHMVDLPELE